jgi:hypothetical protein
LAKFAAPFADGLIGYNYATFQQQLFDIPEAQAEAKVQPYGVADDLDGKSVILLFGSGRCVHAETLPCRRGTRQVDIAHVLLAALYSEETPPWLREVPAVETLRQVWVQQYYLMEETVQWRSIEEHGIPPALGKERRSISKEYALRAGVEGAISQAVGAFGLRRARYFSWLKTHLQHVLTVTALNFVRIGEWLAGTPLAKTRKSAFVRLMEQPLAAWKHSPPGSIVLTPQIIQLKSLLARG